MTTKEKVCVKVLMSMINYATELISTFDEDFQSRLKNQKEKILWKIGEDISFHTIIDNGTIKGAEGTIENPTISFEINDVYTALDLLTRTKAIEEMINEIKIVGDAEKILQLNFILDTVSTYLEDLIE
ncbi:MAG: hypothetical protein ACFFAO_12885 [Candidatus Hermodarchaeota archaeon]